MMDRGVTHRQQKDGTLMIVSSRWNANFGYFLTQESPGA
jgi:hypothetical protein